MLVKEIRLKMKLSQKEFSDRFDIPVSTLRKWEQGESSPSKYLINLFMIAFPELNDELIKISDEKNLYYINTKLKSISDRFGNSFKYNGDIEKVNKKNLLIYLNDFFESLYNLQNNLNRNIKNDQLNKIEWEKISDR